MDPENVPEGHGFLAGGGEMGERMRALDWGATPLGSPINWPQGLRTAVRLLLNSRHPMFIWWGSELIQFYNDAYRRTMGPERHPSALGQRGAECWAEIWDIIGPQIELVMAGQGATWHEDQLVPVTRHGRREDVWWTYGFSPINDDTQPQGVGGVLVVCNDVTQEHLAREALRQSEERLKLALDASGVVGIWDWDIPADRVFADLRFAQLYGVDPEAAKTGAPISDFMRAVHPEDRSGVEVAIRRAIEDGEFFEAEYRLLQVDGSVRWVATRGRCRHDPQGRPLRFPGTAVDVTARRRAEERQALLAREVDHRAKNALAIVQAVVRLTRAPDVSTYRRAVEGRIAALARAQALLAEDYWAGADLRALLQGELEPFLGPDGIDASGPGHGTTPWVKLEGPIVALPADTAQPLAMVVHELATNALKYGALSAPGGRVEITWRLDSGPVGTLSLLWAERGGPAVTGRPDRPGVGSQVLEGTVRGQLGGAVTLAWEATGLVCEIELPLAIPQSAGMPLETDGDSTT